MCCTLVFIFRKGMLELNKSQLSKFCLYCMKVQSAVSKIVLLEYTGIK